MIKKCYHCKEGFSTDDHRRKYCSRKCWSFHCSKNLKEYTSSENIANRNKEGWFRKLVASGLKKYFERNPRKDEGWYIKKYGAGYIPKKAKHCSIWKKLSLDIRKNINVCERCGKRAERYDIHHIIPFSISKENSKTNSICLCRRCHKIIEDTGWKLKHSGFSWEMVRSLIKIAICENRHKLNLYRYYAD